MVGIVVSTCEAYTGLHSRVASAVEGTGLPVVFASSGHAEAGWDDEYLVVGRFYRARLPFNAYDCSWMVDLAHPGGFIRNRTPDVFL
jgi:hypothetical protein